MASAGLREHSSLRSSITACASRSVPRHTLQELLIRTFPTLVRTETPAGISDSSASPLLACCCCCCHFVAAGCSNGFVQRRRIMSSSAWPQHASANSISSQTRQWLPTFAVAVSTPACSVAQRSSLPLASGHKRHTLHPRTVASVFGLPCYEHLWKLQPVRLALLLSHQPSAAVVSYSAAAMHRANASRRQP